MTGLKLPFYPGILSKYIHLIVAGAVFAETHRQQVNISRTVYTALARTVTAYQV